MIEHERVLQIKEKIQREQVKRDLECKECWVGMGKTYMINGVWSRKALGCTIS